LICIPKIINHNKFKLMAFDLNKNDGPTKSKFDLSKSDESTPEVQEPKKSNNKTIIIVVVLAVIAFAVYLFTKDSKTGETSVSTVDSVAPTSDTSSVAASTDTAAASQAPATTSVAPQVSAPATFEKASADVKNVDETKLNQVLEYLKSNPSAMVTIEGYASSEGELNFNVKLSEMRASNFAKFLVSKGVNGDNLKSVGKGVDNPIANNDDETGRSQNRRIEIKF
jgi:outer membrane protein OmpA-like peptidoglycan-associated protein